MKDLMIDLETASIATNAAIIAIGAVWFDRERGELGERFYQAIDLSSAINAGFDVDGEAITWWMQQTETAREVFNDPERVNIEIALERFSEFVGVSAEGFNLWGKGPAFDNAILADAYLRLNLKKPWAYYNDRCVRTLLDVAKIYNIKLKPFNKGIAHNALDDAIYQAECLCQIFKTL
jgi:hypothetical protein